MKRLAGKVALVTGAGQGIGRGIALALARDGANVVLAGRTKAKCDDVAAEITAGGGTASAIQCDVIKRADVERAVEHAVSTYGGLDVLVNNAQTAPPEADQGRTAIKGDPTFGPYAMAKEAIRGLSRVAAREWGPDNIRVNVIVPAAMSPAAEEFSQNYPEMFDRHLKSIPLQRIGDPLDDIGRAVAALVSDDCSYMTGQSIELTGGA